MDRSKWKRVRFGDVVRCVDKTCRDPQAEGLTRVVGLEHLDPGELKISRWAEVSDGTSFTRTFRAGQVLFGKRRAYQRKAAVADFDGICSGDILVFESDNIRLDSRLLPFVVQSDAFFSRAVGSSAGSLSPRTKWSELARFEFKLPPLDDQHRICEVLDEIEAAKWNVKCVLHSLSELWSARMQLASHHSTAVRTQVGLLGNWLSGGTPSRSNQDYWQGPIPWVSPKDMKGPWIGASEETLTEAGAQRLRRAPPETILIVVRGMILAHTLPICFAERELTFNQDVKGLIVGPAFCPRFVHAALRANEAGLLALVDEAGHGTKRLPTDALFRFELSLPSLVEQVKASYEIAEIELQMVHWARHAEKLAALKQGLIASWLGETHV